MYLKPDTHAQKSTHGYDRNLFPISSHVTTSIATPSLVGIVQNLDSGLWTGLWTGQQTNLAFPGLYDVQYLIATSLVSKVWIIQIPMHFFGIDVSV